MFENFSDERITLSTGITTRVRLGGDGPPLLLLHGYPQTHVCWHKVAPQLVDAGFRVILPDLRGYGDADKPKSDEQHTPYSKRAMAQDQIALLNHLGIESVGVVGHDRGGRVAHRLARDAPDRVRALSALDIVPTEHMYATTSEDFARAYYHWFFLIQPSPLPERLIGADPAFFLTEKLRAWSGGNAAAFDEEVVAEYMRCFKDPETIFATCEDYRAAANIDITHDDADKGVRLSMPLQVLWGNKGAIGRLYNVRQVWHAYAREVDGKALPCAHFLPEEAPDETSEALIAFFSR